MEATREKIEEIVKDFPQGIIFYPRGGFEGQLKNHLLKHFGFPQEKQKEKKKEVKDGDN